MQVLWFNRMCFIGLILAVGQADAEVPQQEKGDTSIPST